MPVHDESQLNAALHVAKLELVTFFCGYPLFMRFFFMLGHFIPATFDHFYLKMCSACTVYLNHC